MATVGIDLGVRSAHVAVIDGALILGKVEVPKSTRWKELRELGIAVAKLIEPSDMVFIEEPPIAGSRNIRTGLQLAQTCGALLASIESPCYLVAVGQWKKDVVGKGNVTKDEVSDYLAGFYSRYFAQCKGDQNFIDATCIAMYGETVR